MTGLREAIQDLWERRDAPSPQDREARQVVEEAIDLLDRGELRTAEVAETGEELARGHVPPACVAVQATRARAYPGGTFGLPCLLVVKRLADGERHDKSALEDLLRAHGATT